MMSTALEKASKEGAYLLYINSQDQHYFPLLAVFMANCKEQITLISIKSGYKYSTYHIYINKWHDLITAI